MWSYGMFFYTLLLDKIPYDDPKLYPTFGDVVKAISADLPKLPDNTPEILKQTIERCWSKDPEKRPTFTELTAMQTEHGGNLWETIQKEAAARGNHEVIELWKTAAGSANQVSWAKFEETFWPQMGMTHSQAQENYRSKCIQKLLEVSPTDLIVEHVKFTNFTTLFTPILTGKQGLQFIDGVVALCRKPYFYGLQGRAPAEAVINEVKQKSVPNPFLLRISTTQGVSFCLSYVPPVKSKDKEAIVHLPILPATYQETGIVAYVDKFTPTLKVKSTNGHARNFDKDVFNDAILLTVQQSTTVESYGGQLSGIGSSMKKTVD